MGGQVYRIGDYEAVIMDYAYDDLPEDGTMSRVEYDNLIISFKVNNIKTKSSKEFSISISELHSIKRHDDGRYYIDWDGLSPREWLFNKLVQSNTKIEIIPILSIHVTSNHNLVPDYYLQSEIGDEEIHVSTIPKQYEIKSLSELEWLGDRGFRYK